MNRLALLAPILALLGAGCAHAAETPQQTASIGAGKHPDPAASDKLVGRGIEPLGQQALIRTPDPARPCQFDILMDRQDGRPSVWESVDLCHAPARPPRASGAAKAGQ